MCKNCRRLRGNAYNRVWQKEHPKPRIRTKDQIAKARPRQKELMRLYDEVLTDYIVKNRIMKDFKVPRALITPEMIEMKRNIILARRMVRKLEKEVPNGARF